MEKKSLQEIIVKLKDLVEQLECEVMSDPSAYLPTEDYPAHTDFNYDGLDDDDGYCD